MMGKAISNQGKMPKINFSALKNADLRSVAALGDGLRVSSFATEAEKSAPAAPAPAAVAAFEAPVVQPVQAPVAKSKGAFIVGTRKASLISSAPTAVEPAPVVDSAPVATISATPASPVAPSLPALVSSPISSAANESVQPSAVPEISISKIGTETGGADSIAVAEDPVAVGEAVTDAIAQESVKGSEDFKPAEVSSSNSETLADAIIKGENVEIPGVKSEGQSIFKDEESEKEQEIAAQSAVELFPNLGLEEDEFFKDPIFGTEIDDLKKKKEALGQEALAKEAAENAEAAEVKMSAEAIESAAKVSEAPVVTETEESSAIPAEVSKTAVSEKDPEYVAEVAKDISSTRVGRLANLFWKNKAVISAVAVFFLLSVGGGYAYFGVHKASGPESVNRPIEATGSAVTVPVVQPAINPPADIQPPTSPYRAGIDYKVNPIRKANLKKKPDVIVPVVKPSKAPVKSEKKQPVVVSKKKKPVTKPAAPVIAPAEPVTPPEPVAAPSEPAVPPAVPATEPDSLEL